MSSRMRSTIRATNITKVDVPGGTSVVQTPFGLTGTSEFIDEHVFPNFGRRIANGEILMGYLNRVISRYYESSNTCTVGPHPSWGTRTVTGDIGGFISNVGDPTTGQTQFISYMRDGSLIKAHAKAKESNLLLGEAVATLGQTVSMLKSPFGAARGLIGKISGLAKQKTKRLGPQRAMAESWLEYRYGWRPILGDIRTIKDQVQTQMLSNNGGRKVARSMLKEDRYFEGPAVASGNPGLGTLTIGAHTVSLRVRASSGVIYELLVDSARGRLSRAAGMRVSDIPSTMWELMPWSFVVDWFVGVGDWIRAIAPDPTFRLLGNWVTVVQIRNDSHRDCKWSVTIGSYPVTTYKGSFNAGIHEEVTVTRSVNQNISFIPPPKVNTLSLDNILDGLALASGEVSQLLRTIRH